MSKLIVVDPGHGGSDPGACGNGLRECDLTLRISRDIRSALIRDYDVRVELTRTDDVFIDLSPRAMFANQRDADYFVSIHINAGGGRGYESYIYTSPSDEAIRRQSIVHREVMAYMRGFNVPDRGQKRANFAVLRETAMPALLGENLFIDNPTDAGHLHDEKFLTGLAEAYARGIASAMALPRIDNGYHGAEGTFAAELQVNFSNGQWRITGLPGNVKLGGPSRNASAKVLVSVGSDGIHWHTLEPMAWDAPPLGK